MTRSVLAFLAVAAVALASSTASWEMNTFADFARGRFTGLSLSRDGRVMLAPRLDTLFSSDQPAIWSVAQAQDGSLYVGTGHRGRVYKIHKSGHSELLWSSQQPEIFAVAVGPDNAVYAATSPDGKVFRIQGNRAIEYFDPQAHYIWALAFGKDGALYVGTGDKGKVFRVSREGNGELWYDTGQSHITALAFDSEGRLLAGSEPNGILYRISAKDKAFVLYDANLPEIRSINVAPDGTVYAGALGGSVAQKAAAATTAAHGSGAATTVTAPATTITVTEDSAAAQQGPDIKPRQADQPKAPAAFLPGTVVYSAAQTEVAGVEKSAIYRINLDNTVETLWSSKEENAYDLLLAGSDVMFGTDSNGRVYRVTPDRRVTLLLQTNEGETTRLLFSPEGTVAATATSGKLLRVAPEYSAQGVYESPVHDASSVSRWGQLSWRGERLGQARLAFRTRSGNSARPDRTWSEWSPPLTDPAGSQVASPNARFLQWKAEFVADGATSPTMTGVTLSYLPQNNPPAVRTIQVLTQIAPAGSAAKAAAQPASTATYSVTVTDTGEAGASTLTGTPTQSVSRGISQQIQIVWQADDPDGDKLIYAVYFKGDEESQWKLLRTNFTETTLTLEGEVLADGKYLFRVVASDRPSNASSSARTSELISAPVLFDNTPPLLRATARREESRIEVLVEASDVTSALRRAEYSVDATAWIPIESEDGVIDGKSERFTIRLDNLPPGEHLIVVRAFDASNNGGLAKVVVHVQ